MSHWENIDDDDDDDKKTLPQKTKEAKVSRIYKSGLGKIKTRRFESVGAVYWCRTQPIPPARLDEPFKYSVRRFFFYWRREIEMLFVCFMGTRSNP
jgi:hypothetical protein